MQRGRGGVEKGGVQLGAGEESEGCAAEGKRYTWGDTARVGGTSEGGNEPEWEET